MKLSNQRKSMLMNQELINNENLKMVRKWICDIMRAADFREDEIDIVDLCVYGSRTNGRAHADSDLDILLEYKGRAREDTVFNVLHASIPEVSNRSIEERLVRENLLVLKRGAE